MLTHQNQHYIHKFKHVLWTHKASKMCLYQYLFEFMHSPFYIWFVWLSKYIYSNRANNRHVYEPERWQKKIPHGEMVMRSRKKITTTTTKAAIHLHRCETTCPYSKETLMRKRKRKKDEQKGDLKVDFGNFIEQSLRSERNISLVYIDSSTKCYKFVLI